MRAAGVAPTRADHGPAVRVSVLGHVRATRDGAELDLGPPKHRAVLAALAMAEGQPLDAQALAGLVWPPERLPQDPVSSLHVNISGLRRVLEPPRVPRSRPQVLVTSGGGYALDPGHAVVDAAEVARTADRCRGVLRAVRGPVVPRPAAAPEDLEAALADVEWALAQWYGEPYLDVVPTLAAEAARARLEAIRTSLLEDRAVAQLALGRDSEAAAQLGALVVQRSLDERLWCLYVLALARSDRQADALDAVRTVRDRLAEELGVDPGPALRELHGMLLRHDAALRAPAPPVPTPAPGPAAAAEPAEPAQPPAAVGEPPVTAHDGAGPALVGREREMRLLRAQLQGHGTRIVQIVGEAGIGKSTLVAGLLAEAAGGTVCVARCPEDEGAPPLWPWSEILSALTGDADPVTAPAAEDAEVARFLLFDAVERTISAAAARRRRVLVLEDLHWADSSTARLVAHLATAWAGAPDRRDLLLVITRRPDDGTARPGLPAALDALARHGTLRLDVAGLAPPDVAELARTQASWDVDEDTVATLHARTAGNPFLLGELVRLGEAALRAGEVPSGVTDVLRRRLAAMPEGTRAALVTAAAVGNTFDLDVVAAAGALPDPAAADGVDAVLDALDPAVAAGLVVDSGADRMAFVHALTRDAVHSGIGPTRRSRLHARIAQVLDSRSARPAETAPHWLAAGPRHAARAWRAAHDAAEEAARRLAPDEAAALLDAASTAQAQDPEATAADRTALAESAVAALLRAGHWDRFLARVEEAAVAADAEHDVERVARFAILPAEAGPWTPRPYGTVDPGAVRRMRRVLDALPSPDGALRCRVMLALGAELYFSPDSGRERQALVDEGLAMARRLGDPALLGRVSQRAALVIWRGGNAGARLALATEAVEAATRSGDTDLLQTALDLRMSAAMEAGRVELMLADADRATALLEQRPTVYHAVVLACLLVPWLAAQERFDDAEDRLREALRLGGGSALPWAALALGTASIGLAVWRGDLARSRPAADLARALAHTEPALPSVRLLCDLRAGDVDAVRAFLDTRGHLLETDDFTSLFHHALAAEAAHVVGDPARAAGAYAALAADAGHVVCAGTGLPLGPVDAYLALAAAATGDAVRAARHAEDAQRLVDAWGLTACGAWLRAHRARGGW